MSVGMLIAFEELTGSALALAIAHGGVGARRWLEEMRHAGGVASLEVSEGPWRLPEVAVTALLDPLADVRTPQASSTFPSETEISVERAVVVPRRGEQEPDHGSLSQAQWRREQGPPWVKEKISAQRQNGERPSSEVLAAILQRFPLPATPTTVRRPVTELLASSLSGKSGERKTELERGPRSQGQAEVLVPGATGPAGSKQPPSLTVSEASGVFARLQKQAERQLRYWASNERASVGPTAGFCLQVTTWINESVEELTRSEHETEKAVIGLALRDFLQTKVQGLSDPVVRKMGRGQANSLAHALARREEGRHVAAKGEKSPQRLDADGRETAETAASAFERRAMVWEQSVTAMPFPEQTVERAHSQKSQSLEAPLSTLHPAQPDELSIRWLEDEDLAGRLQRILRRQTRRKGIEVS